MSRIGESNPLECGLCPFFHCPEGDCYDCHCYLDKNVDFGKFWCDDSEETLHKDCPLLKGQIITIKEDEGKLSVEVEYK